MEGLELLLFDEPDLKELTFEGLLILLFDVEAGLALAVEPEVSKLLPGLYLFCELVLLDAGFLYVYLAFVLVLAGFPDLVVTSFCGLVLAVMPVAVPERAGLPVVLPSATVPEAVVDVFAFVLSITALDEPAPARPVFAGIDLEEVVVLAIAGLCVS